MFLHKFVFCICKKTVNKGYITKMLSLFVIFIFFFPNKSLMYLHSQSAKFTDFRFEQLEKLQFILTALI